MKSSSSYLLSALCLFIVSIVFSSGFLSHSTQAMEGFEEDGEKPGFSTHASAAPSEEDSRFPMLLSGIKGLSERKEMLEPYNLSLKRALKEIQDLFRTHLDPKKHLYDCLDIFYTPKGRSAIQKIKDALDPYSFMVGPNFNLREYHEVQSEEIQRFASLPKIQSLSFDEEGQSIISEILKEMIKDSLSKDIGDGSPYSPLSNLNLFLPRTHVMGMFLFWNEADKITRQETYARGRIQRFGITENRTPGVRDVPVYRCILPNDL